jgi:hypothetical protein
VTPAERLRQHQRALGKAQRELDRERTKLEQQEKKLIMDIKKSAKAGQMVCRVPYFIVFYASAPMIISVAHRLRTRTHVRSWQRTLFGRGIMSRSSIKCGPNSRLLALESKHYAAISKWQMR